MASKVKHNHNVRIMKVWHGTSVEIAKKIMEVGFANLAKLDAGWFGKGKAEKSFTDIGRNLLFLFSRIFLSILQRRTLSDFVLYHHSKSISVLL